MNNAILFYKAAVLVSALSLSSASNAAESYYSTTWSSSLDGWATINDSETTKTWKANSGKLEVSNESEDAIASINWVISPIFDCSDGAKDSIFLERLRNGSDDAVLALLFTEDYTGDVNTTTWQTIHADLIASMTVSYEGYNWEAYKEAFPTTSSATARIALKHTSTGTEPCKVRVKNFRITTTGEPYVNPGTSKNSKHPLPYSAIWKAGLEDWAVADSLYSSKTWGWKAEGLAFISDSKQANNDWLISPPIDADGANPKNIILDARWKGAKSSNVSLYYTTSSLSEWNWVEVAKDIIPESHGFGFAETYKLEQIFKVDVVADSIRFALHYAPFLSPEGTQNEIRIYGFKVEEDIPSGTEAPKADNMEIYPNPARDVIHLKACGAKVSVFDFTGQCLLKTQLVSNKIDISHLPSGQYIIDRQKEGQHHTSIFMKK